MKVFFLSHAEEDSKFVTKIANNLGTDRCWTYELDVKPGDSILGYDKGIADSRIFVLFWSIHASNSEWINDEISQARMRINRDNGFRLIVVKLDDYKLPESLAYRLWIDGRKGINHTLAHLRSIEADLTPLEALVGKPILKDVFQNRQPELDLIEQYSISPDSPIIISGLDGIGKSVLIKRANATLFSYLSPIFLDLDMDNTPVRIISSLAKTFSLALEATDMASKPEIIWGTLILPEISESPKTYLIIDNFGAISNFSPSTKSLITRICNDLADIHKRDNPGLIIISWGLDLIDEALLKKFKSIHIRELDDKYISRALKYHLSDLSYKDFTSEQIEKLAVQVRGYPAAIPVICNMVAERGIEATLADTRSLRRMRVVMIENLLSNLEISDSEKEILLLMSISRFPLSNKLFSKLGVDYANPLQSLIKKQLVDISGPPNTVHHIVREYVNESLASPDDITNAHFKLGSLFNLEWRKSTPMSSSRATYGSLACFHLAASGRKREASLIRVEFIEETKQAAIELYRRGQYKRALSFLENVKKLIPQHDPIFDYYYALSLHRFERNEEALEILNSLISKFPKTGRYHHSLGTVYRSLGDQTRAIDSYRNAIVNSSPLSKVTPLLSLADYLCDLGRSQEAVPLVAEVMDIDPSKSFSVAVASRVYEQIGEPEKALRIILDGLRISSSDSRLHHRAGMILKNIGRFKDAIPYLEKASLDPVYPLSTIALTDIYLELNDVEKANEVIENFTGNKHLNLAYLSSKASILRRQGKLEEAFNILNRAHRMNRKDKVIAFGLALVLFDMSNKLITEGGKQQGIIKLKESLKAVSESLEIDPGDAQQLQLKHKIETLLSTY